MAKNVAAETAMSVTYDAVQLFGGMGYVRESLVERLSRESMKILQSEEIKKRFAEVGAVPVGNTPQQFAEYLRADLARWAAVIKSSGARLDG